MKTKPVMVISFIAVAAAIFIFFACRPENRTILGAWPAIGVTEVDKSITNIDAGSRTRLDLVLNNGDVKITRGTQEHVQMIENTRIKGPASREQLRKYLEANKSRVDSASLGIKIDGRQVDGIKPFFCYENDIELILPASLAAVNISIDNGSILMSGLDGMSGIELSVKRGRIHMEKCNSVSIRVSAGDGTILMEDIEGHGTYKCGRGNIQLRKVNGAVDVISVSGDTVIEDCVGKLNCDVSFGSITVSDTELKDDSALYASNGNIEAELEKIEASGKYSIKAASGRISLKMPRETGYSLIARSTRGRIYNEMEPVPETLVKAPSGEIYGDVGNGGASIDVYIDRGNIYLR
jgi:DUF4097 and DUF4098 domain-containing protein YvlB